MARIDPYELADDHNGGSNVDRTGHDRDQDGLGSLRDVEAEAGDDTEIGDDFDMDDRAARELGVDLDDRDEPEPGFD